MESNEEQRTEKAIDNPFNRFKLWTLLPWFILSVLVIMGFEEALIHFEIITDPISIENWEIFGFYGALLGWTAWALISSRIDIRYLIGSSLSRPQWLFTLSITVLIYIFSGSVFYVVNYPLSLLWPEFVSEWILELSDIPTDQGVLSTLLMIVDYVIAAPIVEELLFRGVILHRSSARWGLHRAMITSSVLFALLHPYDIVGTFVFSLALSIVYVRTGSLLAPIAIHSLSNGVTIAITPLTGWTVETISDLQESWPYGLGCFIVSLPFLIVFMRRYWPDKNTQEPYFSNQSILDNI
jgi:uncharacterized protein